MQIRQIKGIQIGKKALLICDTVVCIENSTESTKKSLEQINEFRKFAGYKLVRIQKSYAFL